MPPGGSTSLAPCTQPSAATIDVESTASPIIKISANGDIILAVTFENSKSTLKAARREASSSAKELKVSLSGLGTSSRESQAASASSTLSSTSLQSRTVKFYRVDLNVLKTHSTYFAHLLTSPHFAEASSIGSTFASLRSQGIEPSSASAGVLPRVLITDDDEATRLASRVPIFTDLLLILHAAAPTSKATLSYLATLAVLADRFDCVAQVARHVKLVILKTFRWPVGSTAGRGGVDVANGRGSSTTGRDAMTVAAEEILRMKILVAWIFDLPIKLNLFSKELIIKGSARWSGDFATLSELTKKDSIWWDLPDDLEAELYHRRQRILTAIASLQSHFLRLYTSRTQQCTLFYDSSPACDSFQLGEMIKFFTSKNLLCLTSTLTAPLSLSSPLDCPSSPSLPDFDATPASEEHDPMTPSLDDAYYGGGGVDGYRGDIQNLLTTLRQCPSYQIDKHHAHCGLRTRLIPPLDLIAALLTSGAVGIERRYWMSERSETSWMTDGNGEGREKEKKTVQGMDVDVFRFTRGVDARVRVEGSLVAGKLTRTVFTAKQWDWSAED